MVAPARTPAGDRPLFPIEQARRLAAELGLDMGSGTANGAVGVGQADWERRPGDEDIWYRYTNGLSLSPAQEERAEQLAAYYMLERGMSLGDIAEALYRGRTGREPATPVEQRAADLYAQGTRPADALRQARAEEQARQQAARRGGVTTTAPALPTETSPGSPGEPPPETPVDTPARVAGQYSDAELELIQRWQAGGRLTMEERSALDQLGTFTRPFPGQEGYFEVSSDQRATPHAVRQSTAPGTEHLRFFTNEQSGAIYSFDTRNPSGGLTLVGNQGARTTAADEPRLTPLSLGNGTFISYDPRSGRTVGNPFGPGRDPIVSNGMMYQFEPDPQNPGQQMMTATMLPFRAEGPYGSTYQYDPATGEIETIIPGQIRMQDIKWDDRRNAAYGINPQSGKLEKLFDLPPETKRELVSLGGGLYSASQTGPNGEFELSELRAPPAPDLARERDPDTGELVFYNPKTGEEVRRSGKPRKREPIKGPNGELYSGDAWAERGVLELIPGQPRKKEPIKFLENGGMIIPAGQRARRLERNEGPSGHAYRVTEWGGGAYGDVVAEGAPWQLYSQVMNEPEEETYIAPNMFGGFANGASQGYGGPAGLGPAVMRNSWGQAVDPFSGGGSDYDYYGATGWGQDVGAGGASDDEWEDLWASFGRQPPEPPDLPTRNPYDFIDDAYHWMLWMDEHEPSWRQENQQFADMVEYDAYTQRGLEPPRHPERFDPAARDAMREHWYEAGGIGEELTRTPGQPEYNPSLPPEEPRGTNPHFEVGPAGDRRFPSFENLGDFVRQRGPGLIRSLGERVNGPVIGPWDVMPGGPEQYLRMTVPEAFPEYRPPMRDEDRQLSRGTGYGQDVGSGQGWLPPARENEEASYPFTLGLGQEEPADAMRAIMAAAGRGAPPVGTPMPPAAPAMDDAAGWTPPLHDQDVVGTGHRFGEPVSMEGIHKGSDLQAYQGTPALSPVDGVVVSVEYDAEGLGLQVTVRGGDGEQHKLSHLLSTDVKEGDVVEAGQEIAKVGSTGAGSTGPHLDYRIQDAQGTYLNPEERLGWMGQLPRADKRTGAGQDVGAGQEWWEEQYTDEGFDPNTQYTDEGDAWAYDSWGGAGDYGGNEYYTGEEELPQNDVDWWGLQDQDQYGQNEPAWGIDPISYGDDPSQYAGGGDYGWGGYDDYGGGGYVDPYDVPDDYRYIGDPGTYDENTNTQFYEGGPVGPGTNPSQNPYQNPTTTGPYGNPYADPNHPWNQNTVVPGGRGPNPNVGQYPTSSMTGGGYGPGGSPPSGGPTYGSTTSGRPTTSGGGGGGGGIDPQELALAQQRLAAERADADRNYALAQQRLQQEREIHGDSIDLRQREMDLQTQYNQDRLAFDRDQLGINTALRTTEITSNWQQHQDNDQLQRDLADLRNATDLQRLDLDRQGLDYQQQRDDARLGFDYMVHGDSIELQRQKMANDTAYNENRMALDSRQVDLTEQRLGFDMAYGQQQLAQQWAMHQDDNAYKQGSLALQERIAGQQMAIDQARLGIDQQRIGIEAQRAAVDQMLGMGQLQNQQQRLAMEDSWNNSRIAIDQARLQSENAWREIQARAEEAKIGVEQGRLAIEQQREQRLGSEFQQTFGLQQYKTEQDILNEKERLAIQREQLGLQEQSVQNDIYRVDKEYDAKMKEIENQYRMSGDKLAFDREALAATNQRDAAQRELQMQLAQLQSATTKEVQGTFKEREAAALRESALKNPWLQMLTGMAPEYGTPGGPGWTPPPNTMPAAGTPGAAAGTQLAVGDAAARQAAAQQQGVLGATQGMERAPAGSLGAQIGAAGGWTPPAMSGLPSYDQFQQMTPFQKAAMRTSAEMAGTPWEAVSQQLRTNWAQAGGPTQAPGTSQLAAARMNPRQQANRTMTANTFGLADSEYWQNQAKGWQPAQAAQVQVAA